MAKMIIEPHRVRVGSDRPRLKRSRVVSCAGFIKAPDVRGFGYTEALGVRVWLLGVRVWFDPHIWAALNQVGFHIFRGQGIPATPAEIHDWQNILPCKLGAQTGVGWYRTQEFGDYEWSMEQLFEGNANRFGFWFVVSPGMAYQEMRVSFQISEG